MCGISHEYQLGLLLNVQTGLLGLTLGLRSEDRNCLKFYSLRLHFVPFPFPLFRCVRAEVVKGREAGACFGLSLSSQFVYLRFASLANQERM